MLPALDFRSLSIEDPAHDFSDKVTSASFTFPKALGMDGMQKTRIPQVSSATDQRARAEKVYVVSLDVLYGIDAANLNPAEMHPLA